MGCKFFLLSSTFSGIFYNFFFAFVVIIEKAGKHSAALVCPSARTAKGATAGQNGKRWLAEFFSSPLFLFSRHLFSEKAASAPYARRRHEFYIHAGAPFLYKMRLHIQIYSTTSANWSFPTPQIGHTQSSGISSKAVPGAMPPSGSPSSGS